jgi:hypothetical protein
MTLLEVVLALAVFSLAAVGLLRALRETGQAALEARRDLKIDREMRSLLEFYGRASTMEPLREELPPKDGVEFLIEREPLELFNKDGQPLTGMALLKITAMWSENGQRVSREQEIWCRAGLYVQEGL